MPSSLFERIRESVESQSAYGLALADDAVLSVGFIDDKIALQLETPSDDGGRTRLTAALTLEVARLVGDIINSFADRGEAARPVPDEGPRTIN